MRTDPGFSQSGLGEQRKTKRERKKEDNERRYNCYAAAGASYQACLNGFAPGAAVQGQLISPGSPPARLRPQAAQSTARSGASELVVVGRESTERRPFAPLFPQEQKGRLQNREGAERVLQERRSFTASHGGGGLSPGAAAASKGVTQRGEHMPAAARILEDAAAGRAHTPGRSHGLAALRSGSSEGRACTVVSQRQPTRRWRHGWKMRGTAKEREGFLTAGKQIVLHWTEIAPGTTRKRGETSRDTHAQRNEGRGPSARTQRTGGREAAVSKDKKERGRERDREE